MENRKSSWSSLFLLTFLAAHLYMFNEWVFTATRPSYMNDLSVLQHLQIFIAVSGLLTSLCFLSLLPLVLLDRLPFFKQYTNKWINLGAWVPAGVFTGLILIMVDNFTYTVFRFGIVSSERWIRVLYAAGFVVAAVLCYQSVLQTLKSLDQRINAWRPAPQWIFSGLAALLLLSFTLLGYSDRPRAISFAKDHKEASKLMPDILLVTSDGVNAINTSLYGYNRDTTPNLVKLAQSSLVADNAFANADHSTGSVISMYTSKHPDETRVYFAHNILEGEDAYEHLPGILRSHGYKTVQITIPYYLDPHNVNLQNGFDEVKITGTVHSQLLNTTSKIVPGDRALFIVETADRLLSRVRHIFFIERMNNPRLLAQPDVERWEIFRQKIRTSDEPLFVHIHLMVTHGKRFNPVEQVYSAGRSIQYQEPWNVDFYDDSILDFDKNVGELLEYLTDLDLLDKTVLIIGSDHSQQWIQYNRIPLLIRFPHEEYVGRIQVNVQNLDIAPTILDYIGIEPPDWMRGKSLIAGDLQQRPLFSVAGVLTGPDSGTGQAPTEEQVTSLVDGVQNVTMIYCQKWFKLDLSIPSWETGAVEGSTTTCTEEIVITDQQAFEWIREHLSKNDFDVSKLDQLPPSID